MRADNVRQRRVRQSFVSRYEAGERLLNILELRRVCRALGLPLDEFARRLDEVLGADDSVDAPR